MLQVREDYIVTDTTTQFKRQFPRNSFFQVLGFISHMTVGILLVPYLVKHLGRAAYGLVPIAGMMTQYVSLISQSISSATNRFLTIALQQNDVDEANRIFNTAFFSYLAIGMLQIPVFMLVIYYASTIFSIPKELYSDVIILLICSAMSYMINLVCSVFTVPMYASNRLDISRGLDIVRLILRLAGIVTLFIVFEPILRYVGYVDLSLTLILCVARIQIARRLAPMLQVAFKYYDWRKVGELIGMGGWLLINHLAFLLLLRVDVWICNRFVSPEAAGDYAAVLQWSNLIRQIGNVVALLVAPMITIYYAKSELQNVIRLSKVSVRVLSLILAVLISIFCILSKSILGLWLGDSFVRLWPLMVIMLCHLVVTVGVFPLYHVQVALKKVRCPGIVAFAMGLFNVVLAIAFAKYTNWGIYGVAIAGGFVLTMRSAFFIPIYTALILQQPWYTFIKSYLSALVFLTGLLLIELLFSSHFRPTSWFQLVMLFLCFGVFGLVCCYFFLSKQDRKLIINIVPSWFHTHLSRLSPT